MSAVSRRRAGAIAAPGRVARRWSTSVRALPSALVVLLVLAFVHATAWAVVTAPWQGPDEVAHFAYAEQLARTGHAPQRNGGTGGQSTAHNLALFQLNLFPIRLQPGGRPTYSALPRTNAGPRRAAGPRLRRRHRPELGGQLPAGLLRLRGGRLPRLPLPQRARAAVLHAAVLGAADGRRGRPVVVRRPRAAGPRVGGRDGHGPRRPAAEARLRGRDRQPRRDARPVGHRRAAGRAAPGAARSERRARRRPAGVRGPGRADPSARLLPAAVRRDRGAALALALPARLALGGGGGRRRRGRHGRRARGGDGVGRRAHRQRRRRAERVGLAEHRRRLQRAAVPGLPVAVLPAQAVVHVPQGGAAGLRLPPDVHRDLLRVVRVRSASTTGRCSTTSCSCSPASASSRCTRRWPSAGARSWRAGRSSC